MKRYLIGLVVVLMPALAAAVAPTCYNYLFRNTYNGGIQPNDLCLSPPCGQSLSATYGVQAQGGSLVLTPIPHDIENIRLPFDQDVNMMFVGSNQSNGTYGRGSHTLGWFYNDTSGNPGTMGQFLDGWGNLKDQDGDGIPDFFQTASGWRRPNDGLFHMSDSSPWPGAPDLTNAYAGNWWWGPPPKNFSDGGRWPHIPNVLEGFMRNAGGIIWENTEDDNDFNTYVNGNGGGQLSLASDQQGQTCMCWGWCWWGWNFWCMGPPEPNGMPDYDVNGDGAVDNDPISQLGQVSGNREIILNLNSYVDQTTMAEPVGIPWYLNYSSPWIPQQWLCWWILVPVTYCWWDFWFGWWCQTIWVLELVCGWADYTFASGGGWWRETYWESQDTKMRPYWGQWSWQWPNGWYNASVDHPIHPYFSKQLLNTDRYPQTSGWPSYRVKNVNIGTTWPNVDWWTGIQGWLTGDQMSRLNQNGVFLQWTPEIHSINSTSGAYAPHAFLGAPYNGPNSHMWLIGFEDFGLKNQFCSSPFYTCKSPPDYNNLVMWMQGEDGGSAISKDLSGDCGTYPASCIPPQALSSTTISKVHFGNFSPRFSWCNQVPISTRVDLYYSVDDGLSWHLVVFNPNTPNDAVIDVQSQGYSGAHLRWKINMITGQTDSQCQISVPAFNVGYDAVTAGNGATYQTTELLPVANAMLRSQYETVAVNPQDNDISARGHVTLTRLYDPDNNNLQDPLPHAPIWDAGQVLASTPPNARNIYYENGGALNRFTDANPPCGWWFCPPNPLPPLLVPYVGGDSMDGAGVNRHCDKVDGKCVYDLDGDGNVNDNDGHVVIRWTLGWELNGWQQRPWKLGGIFHSSPAIVGPPQLTPWWLNGGATPAGDVTAYKAFQTGASNRRTITVVGAGDGMIHAFDAGAFRQDGGPDDKGHGYFLKTNNTRDYGTGSELWAVIPQYQLPRLRNNVASLQSYKPSKKPRATMDGALTVADIITYMWGWGNPQVRTIAVLGDGETEPPLQPNPAYDTYPTHPSNLAAWQQRSRYLSALDISNPYAPAMLWGQDWTDADFNGATWGPAIGPTQTQNGRVFTVAATSGLAPTPRNEYAYLIDAGSGTTTGKVLLNQQGPGGVTYGVVGSPIMIDFTSSGAPGGNGVIDRVYVVDTLGRLYKINTAQVVVPNQWGWWANNSAGLCYLGTLGESVYSSLAVDVVANQQVNIYVGGGPDPNAYDTNPRIWHFAKFEDFDGINQCNPAKVGFMNALPFGQKVWASPVISGGTVYVATTTSAILDPSDGGPGSHQCSSSTGDLIGFDTGNGGTVTNVSITGNVVGGLRAFDGHLFLNGISGTSTIFGSNMWNNGPQGGQGTQPGGASLPTTFWSEP